MCRVARIRSVAKNRSAIIPTKNGETIAATAVVPYASPICSPEKCNVWASHVPMVTDQAPHTKYCRNIIVESRRRVFSVISPPRRVPGAFRHSRYVRIQTRRRKIDSTALFGAEVSGHQKLHHFQPIFECKRWFPILEKCPYEVTVFGLVSVSRGFTRYNRHLANFRVLLFNEILTGVRLYFTAKK